MPARFQKRHLSEIQREEIFKLLSTGWSIKAIARELHHSDSTISQIAKEMGFTLHRGNPNRKVMCDPLPEEIEAAKQWLNSLERARLLQQEETPRCCDRRVIRDFLQWLRNPDAIK